MASGLTVSNQPAGANPLDDVHTDEAEQHQGNGQLAEMIEPHSYVHLHLQQEEANVGINHIADMPPLLADRFVINVPAHETIKNKNVQPVRGS